MKAIFENKGFAMVEAMISLVVVALIIVTFQSLITQSIKINKVNELELKANLYLREAIEITKDLEVSDWNQLIQPACDSACHPEIISNDWVLSAGEENNIDGTYTRNIRVRPVNRDQLAFPNQIVESGGVNDPNTKKVIVSIAWDNTLGPRNLTLETYVYNNAQ